MENTIEKSVEKILSVLPQLEDEQMNNVAILARLGFIPLPPRSGCGAFYQWYKEVHVGIDKWRINVLLDKKVSVFIRGEYSAKELYDGNGFDNVEDALVAAFETVRKR